MRKDVFYWLMLAVALLMTPVAVGCSSSDEVDAVDETLVDYWSADPSTVYYLFEGMKVPYLPGELDKAPVCVKNLFEGKDAFALTTIFQGKLNGKTVYNYYLLYDDNGGGCVIDGQGNIIADNGAGSAINVVGRMTDVICIYGKWALAE